MEQLEKRPRLKKKNSWLLQKELLIPKQRVIFVTEEWPYNSWMQVGKRSESVVQGAITTHKWSKNKHTAVSGSSEPTQIQRHYISSTNHCCLLNSMTLGFVVNCVLALLLTLSQQGWLILLQQNHFMIWQRSLLQMRAPALIINQQPY